MDTELAVDCICVHATNRILSDAQRLERRQSSNRINSPPLIDLIGTVRNTHTHTLTLLWLHKHTFTNSLGYIRRTRKANVSAMWAILLSGDMSLQSERSFWDNFKSLKVCNNDTVWICSCQWECQYSMCTQCKFYTHSQHTHSRHTSSQEESLFPNKLSMWRWGRTVATSSVILFQSISHISRCRVMPIKQIFVNMHTQTHLMCSIEFSQTCSSLRFGNWKSTFTIYSYVTMWECVRTQKQIHLHTSIH